MTGYLDTLVQRGDYARYFSDDVSWLTVGPNQELHGRAAVGQFIRWFHEQAFDAAPRLTNLFVADGKAAIEAAFVGRPTAEFFGVAATGREVTIPYCVIYDVAGAQITALRAYLPLDLLLQQLGATPSAG
jgi:predicted ester cyclase